MEAGRRRSNAIARNLLQPFTSCQLEELHNQAIIFNRMSLGLPIPSHLIFSLRKSGSSQPKLGFFPHRSPPEWGCLQSGSSGREEDPEPGRCRRTDGKKWRCSRAACPDSKYCERHLHRGKNRVRKHTEPHLLHTITSTSSPCSPLSLPPVSQSKRAAHEEHRYRHNGNENGVEQSSSSGISGLGFQQHCFVMGADLRMGRPAEPEKPISLHCFFDERPKNTRRDEEMAGSESRDPVPLPFPALLDLNV